MTPSDASTRSYWFNASAWMLCALIIAGCVVRPVTPAATTPEPTIIPTVTPSTALPAATVTATVPTEIITPTIVVTTTTTIVTTTITTTAGAPAITDTTGVTATEAITPIAPLTPTTSVTLIVPVIPITPVTPTTPSTATATGPLTATAIVTVTGGVSTIVEIIQTTPGLELLAEAMNASGMNNALALPGPFTFFAPNNEAFAALSPEQLNALLSSPTALVNMINYHTIIDQVTSAQLLTLGAALASSGQSITIALAPEGGITANDARIVQPDVIASNGVIHIIDRILTPPTP